jgi:hypothetical protein
VTARTRSAQRGYVLVLVLATLALVALMAGRFAARIDELRHQSSLLAVQGRARVEAASALAATLYVISTVHTGPAGFGPELAPTLRADDSSYLLPGGAQVSVQDLRGLYPLNAVDRPSFARLLRSLGVASTDTDTLTDILLDYEDTSGLKRLNGAGRSDYAAMGLLPPRNDWVLSVRELQRMPVWRDRPDLINALDRLASTSRSNAFNPNTAPRQVLQAMTGDARPEQFELFETMRRRVPFSDGDAATRATGLPLAGDSAMFWVSDQLRITVWAPGLPQALQYNVLLLPGGAEAPWLISETHPGARPPSSDAPDRATAFPLALAPDRP